MATTGAPGVGVRTGAAGDLRRSVDARGAGDGVLSGRCARNGRPACQSGGRPAGPVHRLPAALTLAQRRVLATSGRPPRFSRLSEGVAPPRNLAGVAREIVILTNPTSGKGRGMRIAKATTARLRDAGCAVRSLVGRDADEARDLAKCSVADGIDALVVVGGDGMVHLGAQAVVGSDAALGIVPAGSGRGGARGGAAAAPPGGAPPGGAGGRFCPAPPNPPGRPRPLHRFSFPGPPPATSTWLASVTSTS